MSNKEKSSVMIVYANDVAYVGYVDPEEVKNVQNGVRIDKPYVINVRPVENEGRLDAVMLDIILPIEFAGVPFVEGVYSGFMYLTTANFDLPNGKTHHAETPNGEHLSVNRVAAIADRNEPFLRLYNITKIIKPSSEVEMIYKFKVDGAAYNELLFSARAVDLRPIQSNDNAQEPPPPSQSELEKAFEKMGSVVDLTTKQ